MIWIGRRIRLESIFVSLSLMQRTSSRGQRFPDVALDAHPAERLIEQARGQFGKRL